MVTEIVILCFALALIGAMRLIAELFKVAHASREGDQFRALKRYQIGHAHADQAQRSAAAGTMLAEILPVLMQFMGVKFTAGDETETPEEAGARAKADLIAEAPHRRRRGRYPPRR